MRQLSEAAHLKIRTFPLVAAALLAAAATPVTAEEPPVYSGFFLVGEPVGFFALDACGEPTLEGVNSNCVALAAEHADLPYAIEATDEVAGQTGETTVLDVIVCFYTDDAWIDCDTAVVPTDATRMSVSAFGGVGVSWTVTVG